MASKQDIARQLKQIEHLPQSPITDANAGQILEQYLTDLGDIPTEILEAAVISYRTGVNPFFPSSGQLREKAIEIMLVSMDVPSAAEAWAQVLTAIRFVNSVWCPEGERLYKAVGKGQAGEYWDALFSYKNHAETCETCERGGFKEVYSHPVIANVVKKLGGRESIFTDNLVADRSQFIRAYDEITKREIKIMTMAAPVREAVLAIASKQLKELAAGMSVRDV